MVTVAQAFGRGGGGPSNTFRELIERSLRGQEALLPRRAMDCVYSKDAAHGAVLALETGRLASRVFNISTGRVYRAEEIAETVTPRYDLEAAIRDLVEWYEGVGLPTA